MKFRVFYKLNEVGETTVMLVEAETPDEARTEVRKVFENEPVIITKVKVVKND